VLKNAIDSPDSENVIIAFFNLQDHFALTKGKQSLIIDAMQESQLTKVGEIYRY